MLFYVDMMHNRVFAKLRNFTERHVESILNVRDNLAHNLTMI